MTIKICYLPTLNPACAKMRMDNPASAIHDIYKNQDFKVFVDYVIDPASNRDWTSALVGNYMLEQRVEGMFKVFDVVITQWVPDSMAWDYLKLMANKYNKKLAIDLDDAVGFDNPDNPQIEQRLNQYNYNLAKRECKEADFIITSTEYLKKLVSKYNKEIYVMHNFLIPTNQPAALKPSDKIRCLYMSASGHSKEVNFLIDVFKDLQDTHELVLRISSKDIPERAYNIDYKQVSWPIYEVENELFKLNPDVVLAPLVEDTIFNRCKSELKVLEGLMLNRQIVAQDCITFNNLLEKPSKEVLYANTKEDWIKVLKSIKPKAIGREYLDANYNPTNIANDLLNYIKEQLSNKGPIIKAKYNFN